MMSSSVILLIVCTISLSTQQFSISFPPAASFHARPSGRPFTVAVEGNIGSGKSTLLDVFSVSPNIAIHREPKSMGSYTEMQGLLFSDPERWGMSMVSLVTLTYTEMHLAGRKEEGVKFKPVKLIERSIHSARAFYLERLKSDGNITPAEVDLQDRLYSMLDNLELGMMEVDLIVYLRTSPEVARARFSNKNPELAPFVPLSQYHLIHELYEDWLVHKNRSMIFKDRPLPQLVILDADQDIFLHPGTLADEFNRLVMMLVGKADEWSQEEKRGRRKKGQFISFQPCFPFCAKAHLNGGYNPFGR